MPEAIKWKKTTIIHNYGTIEQKSNGSDVGKQILENTKSDLYGLICNTHAQVEESTNTRARAVAKLLLSLRNNGINVTMSEKRKIDALVEMPREKWSEIQEYSGKGWPRSVALYYMLKIQSERPAMADELMFQVFCPHGDVSNGVVILNIKGVLYEVIIFANTENTDKLVDALAMTQVIDWDRNICVPYADDLSLNCYNEAARRIGLKTLKIVPTFQYLLPKDAKLFDVELPPETYFGPLRPQHVDQVNDSWPHRYETSKAFMRLLIDNDLSYGLFSVKDDELIAWVLICEAGFIRHLYCVEGHRRRGYAEVILKYCINDQLKKGNDLYAYVLDDNVKSVNLFKKLGFEMTGRGTWTFAVKDK